MSELEKVARELEAKVGELREQNETQGDRIGVLLEIVAKMGGEKKALLEAYNQYTFFLDGYSKGSASISEVNAAHNEFVSLLNS